MSRPTVADLTGDHELALLARQHWLLKPLQKVLPETLKQIWDAVQEDAGAPFCLLLLEQLQALERYLWPAYDDEASDQHVILLAYLCNVKRQEHLPVWTLFADRPDEFSSFFQRVTRLSIDAATDTRTKTHLLSFLVEAFQSLDNGLVRKECAPLVGIGIWQHLHSNEAREMALARHAQLQKAWKSSQKKLQGLDQVGQSRVKFERSWLFTAIMEFLDKLYQISAAIRQDALRYCERFLELLCDLQSQLPTRRYVNALLKDVNVLSAAKLSPLYQDGDDSALLREMLGLLEHYTCFPIDDQNGKQLSRTEYDAAHNASIAKLQCVALKQQPEKLKILVLANYGSLAQKEELLGHLKALNDVELLDLCRAVGLRTSYPRVCQIVVDRAFLDEVIAANIEARPYFSDSVQDTAILPTERSLYDAQILRPDDWDGSRPLPIPKLNLQYLTLGDFLWRAYTLYRSEAFYSIRKHLEDTVKRLQLRTQGAQTRFDGFSRLAIPSGKPAVVEIVPARVGEEVPAEVRVEIILDVSRLQPGLRKEWDSLRADDVVFLVAAQPAETERGLTDGNAVHVQAAAEKAGIKAVRSAQVISVLDENGRTLRVDQDGHDHIDGLARPRQRRLLLKLDAISFQADKERINAGEGDLLDSINVIIRRRSRENNFKPVLDTLRQLVQCEHVPVPRWLQDVFLGYGDPASASFKRLPNRLKSIDYRDTFVDWQHLIEALPSRTVEPDPRADASFPPPYVLESLENAAAAALPSKPNKKRKREQPDGDAVPPTEAVRVSTYKPPNAGPYITDAPRTNQVRFTDKQIEAITSGTQPGLTVVVGPPGTGKTDVTTQMISNIYHNFPLQRTLLVAHSNQALNQLFQKITRLDIDERHLLRLGHGEEELETEASFSKAGRVESFLERGGQYLAEVQRLAASIDAPGAHGSSCETAEYFEQVWIQPRWKRYWDEVRAGADVMAAFPFAAYFANAAQPLFPSHAGKERQIDIAKGCERHLRRLFDELAEIRPFEILRNQRDKSNYLLVKKARIIAMTSTHAAIRRQEIANLGFKYDNVIMEEAAQVNEAESFIPLVLQDPSKSSTSSDHSLQRIVLVGDHLQNSPVIQNAAFRSYANLEQSLFQRLIRLGVPHINLDAQGRSRPSIAALYKWRYPSLTNLPFTSMAPEFVQANAGFRYEYQFVNAPDYKGIGETEPSPHFIQNLGEAEYAVALYQYMRLLGYPAEKITILTAYAGQKALIRDVLTHRCKNNRLFGMPGWVGTVDKYQGEQNDYVILSLVRTKTPGYLRDVRRLTVALSRARFGLYILGRKEVFESSLELREAFALLFERPNKLVLTIGEMFTTSRLVEEKVEGTEIEGVEHLGQYVYEMTQAKVKALREGGGVLPPAARAGRVAQDGESDDEDAKDEIVEDEEQGDDD